MWPRSKILSRSSKKIALKYWTQQFGGCGWVGFFRSSPQIFDSFKGILSRFSYAILQTFLWIVIFKGSHVTLPVEIRGGDMIIGKILLPVNILGSLLPLSNILLQGKFLHHFLSVQPALCYVAWIYFFHFFLLRKRKRPFIIYLKVFYFYCSFLKIKVTLFLQTGQTKSADNYANSDTQTQSSQSV